MPEIYLIVMSVAAGAAHPSIQYTKQPSLAVCWRAAAAYVEADKPKASAALPQLGAGCGVVFVPGRGQ